MNELAFLDAIADDPQDAVVRRVFADWLEDRDDPRAALLRLQADYLDREDDGKGIVKQLKAWMKRHASAWLGERIVCVLDWHRDLLEVRCEEAPLLLEGPGQEGLRQALRDGWVRVFLPHLWPHEQLVRAAKLGLLAGPAELHLTCYDGITDADLALLANLPRLRTLGLRDLGHSTLEDDSLRHLAGLPRLRDLRLHGIRRLEGSGLAHLAGLKELRRLEINCCLHLTEGLAHLADLPALRELALITLNVTDAGLAHIGTLVELRSLNLSSGTTITNAGLAHLAGLHQLEQLDLSGCLRITSAGLAPLANLKELKHLELCGCKLKPRELGAFGKALPDCEVTL
jgi:uncharacterized protein (TIGR02996 family)